jgi:hypothetical protein
MKVSGQYQPPPYLNVVGIVVRIVVGGEVTQATIMEDQEGKTG